MHPYIAQSIFITTHALYHTFSYTFMQTVQLRNIGPPAKIHNTRLRKRMENEKKNRAGIPIPKRARSYPKWRSTFNQLARENIKNKRWRRKINSNWWCATGNSKPGGTPSYQDKFTKETSWTHSPHPNSYHHGFKQPRTQKTTDSLIIWGTINGPP